MKKGPPCRCCLCPDNIAWRHNHEYSFTRAYRRYVYASASIAFGHEDFLHGPPFLALTRLGAGSRQTTTGRWSVQFLVYQAMLMAYDSSATLQDRFTHARQVLIEMFPSRRRPGRTYQGFIKALKQLPVAAVDRVNEHLQECHKRVAGKHWQLSGWIPFACDGSRVEVPRTQANEAAFGCAGRKKTGPQLALTVLYHMGTGLPWAWRTGPGTDAERGHLRSMLSTLPPGALLVADAGFTGYDLLRTLLKQGLSFLIRVGANVTLLKDLGLEVAVDGDTVWLWPQNKRDEQPLKLRLIRLKRDSGSPDEMCLLTNVFDRERLSDETAAALYKMRWGVEVFFRSFKQTLQQRKMRSRSPEAAMLELHWALVALLLLGLMSVEPLMAEGHDPLRLSVATALRVVRHSMQTPRAWRIRGDLRMLLGKKALKDGYRRRGSKKARDWPHKKRESPPGVPKIRKATNAESIKAKRIYETKRAA